MNFKYGFLLKNVLKTKSAFPDIQDAIHLLQVLCL